jgi:hypothetical protein
LGSREASRASRRRPRRLRQAASSRASISATTRMLAKRLVSRSLTSSTTTCCHPRLVTTPSALTARRHGATIAVAATTARGRSRNACMS